MPEDSENAGWVFRKIGSVMPIMKMPKVYYEPKEDITAYELAKATPVIALMHHVPSTAILSYIDVLPADVQRHFRIEP